MIVYFIKPDRYDFTIYSINIGSFAKGKAINIGYNNGYEMRSQYLNHPWVSDNIDDLREILKSRKVSLLKEQYLKMIKLMQINENGHIIEYDGFSSPF